MNDTPGWSTPDPQGDRTPGDQPAAGQQPGWSAEQPPAQPGWGPAPPPPPPPPPPQQQQQQQQQQPGQGWDQAQPQQGWGQAQPQQGWGWHRPPEVKPGVIPLRPLGVGEILDGAITTMRQEWRLMLGLSAIFVTVQTLFLFGGLYLFFQDVVTLEELGEAATGADIARTLADSVPAFVLGFIFTFFGQIILQGLLTVVVSRSVLGQHSRLADTWAVARPRLWPLIGLSALIGLLLAGVMFALLAPGFLALGTGAPDGLTALLFVVGVLTLAVLLPFIWVTLSLAPPALVLEKQPVINSMSRSRTLVSGSRWRVLGILVLAWIISTVIAQILSMPFGIGSIFTFPFMDEAAMPGAGYFILNGIGTILAGTVTLPFPAAVAVLLYVDQRIRREALDLELARSAGVTLPGSAGTPTP